MAVFFLLFIYILVFFGTPLAMYLAFTASISTRRANPLITIATCLPLILFTASILFALRRRYPLLDNSFLAAVAEFSQNNFLYLSGCLAVSLLLLVNKHISESGKLEPAGRMAVASLVIFIVLFGIGLLGYNFLNQF